jgi:biopolymer transport protein ExbB
MATASFDFRTLLHDGGFIMAPLVACSVLATIVLVERTIALFGLRRRGARLSQRVLALARRAEFAAARAAIGRGGSTPLGAIFAAALDRAESARHAAAALERARTAEVQELKRGLWILGTIGASAPFVGLFGTVVGIIESFQEIAHTGQGGFSTVAAGISEALIATGSGIVVAVIAFAAHNYFQVRVSSIALDWKLRGEEFLEALEEGRAFHLPAPRPELAAS